MASRMGWPVLMVPPGEVTPLASGLVEVVPLVVLLGGQVSYQRRDDGDYDGNPINGHVFGSCEVMVSGVSHPRGSFRRQ